MTDDDGKTPADRLEKALRENEARKRAAAEFVADTAPDPERLRALDAQLAALPHDERRRVLDDAGFPHRSAAPGPIDPIRGGGHVPRARTAPPRWQVWKALPAVELWKAVLLSLDIEPEQRWRNELGHGRPERSRFIRASLTPEAFDRLDVCRMSFESGGTLQSVRLRYGGSLHSDMASLVRTVDVADFLALAGFTVPDEMRAKGPAVSAAPLPAPAAGATEPATEADISSVTPSDNTKRWTADRLFELGEYRKKHGTKKAAEWAKVSEQRVRELLPREPPALKGFSAFNPRGK